MSTGGQADRRADQALPAPLHDRLREAYGRPPRHHHTHAHAAAVARTVVELGGDRPCVLAAWFHDVVYDAVRTDNEDRSAAVLRAWLLGDPDAREAARLVELTRTHSPAPGDHAGAILCDADLAVLAAPPAAYEAYRTAVRREYAHVSAEGWRSGRAAVLRGLLGRDPLYRTSEGRRRFEASARRNMTAELTDLEV